MLLLTIYLLSYPLTYNLNSQATIALIVFFVLDSFSNLKQKLSRLKNHKLIIMLMLFVVVQLLGLTHSQDLSRGIKVVERFLPLLLLPTVILLEPLKREYIKQLITIFKLGLLFTIAYFFVTQYIVEGRSLGTVVHFALKEVDISQHNISILFVLAIMLCVHDIFKSEKVLFNVLCVIPLSICLLLFSSRVSLLILALCLVIFFITHFKTYSVLQKTGILSIAILGLVVLLFASPDLQNKTKRVIRSTDFNIEVIKTKNSVTYAKNTIEHRVLMNICSFNIISQNIIFGVGTGDYLEALVEEYKNINFKAGMHRRFNAHNQYLQEFIKHGLLGFILYIGVVFVVFKGGFKTKRHILYAAIALAILSFTESVLARQHGVGFLAFYIPFMYLLEKLE